MDNKELVRTALTEVFVNGDVSQLDRFWGPEYTQHNPDLDSGIEALREALNTYDVKYEIGTVIGDGNLVAVHARIEGWGPEPQVVVDIFRVKNGRLVEHWDVLQEEVPADKTVSKNPMWPAR